jgi:hypothetical protein
MEIIIFKKRKNVFMLKFRFEHIELKSFYQNI